MGIEKYRLADCTLFRLPPLDLSDVTDAIEKSLVDAWENGISVGHALDSMLDDNKVVDNLTEQLKASLEFQKENSKRNAHEAAEKRIDEYDSEKEGELKEIEDEYSETKMARRKAAEERRKKREARRAKYKATQKRLEEMRKRIKGKLKKVGGEEGLDALLAIEESLESSLDYEVESEAEDEDFSLGGVEAILARRGRKRKGRRVRRSGSAKEATDSPYESGKKAASGTETEEYDPDSAEEDSDGEDKIYSTKQPASGVPQVYTPLPRRRKKARKKKAVEQTGHPAAPIVEKKLEEKVSENEEEELTEQGTVYRFFHKTPLREKVYNFLTYKVW